MSQFTADLSSATGQVPEVPPPPALLAGAVAAMRAASASFAVVFAPVVVYWIVGSPTQTGWQQAVRIALDGWLLGHQVPILLAGGGALSLTPLGLFAVVLAACWFAGRWLSRTLDPKAVAVEAMRSGALGDTRRPPRPKRAPTRALVVFVGGYAAIMLVASLFAIDGASGPVPVVAAFAGALVVLTAGLPGAYAWSHDGLLAGAAACCAVAGDWLATRSRGGSLERWAVGLRRAVPRWLIPARDVLVAVLTGGAILFVAALASSWTEVRAVYGALDPGIVGGIGLVLLNLVLVPNACVWCAAFVVGPGFALGADTALGPAGSSIAGLPALPIFGAAPDPGVFPNWIWLVLLVPAAAGVWAGVRIARSARSERAQVIDALGSALLSGVAFGALSWLAGGSLGPGRMSHFGADALLVTVALAGEVALTSMLTVVAWQTFRGVSVRGRASE
jgi:hypothetical protein